jgi:hypothetical protein
MNCFRRSPRLYVNPFSNVGEEESGRWSHSWHFVRFIPADIYSSLVVLADVVSQSESILDS